VVLPAAASLAATNPSPLVASCHGRGRVCPPRVSPEGFLSARSAHSPRYAVYLLAFVLFNQVDGKATMVVGILHTIRCCHRNDIVPAICSWTTADIIKFIWVCVCELHLLSFAYLFKLSFYYLIENHHRSEGIENSNA
jgi:hypothetical protein